MGRPTVLDGGALGVDAAHSGGTRGETHMWQDVIERPSEDASEPACHSDAAGGEEGAAVELTGLLAAIRGGDGSAIERVVAIAYRELHALASARLRRSPHSTLLDTTGLLHECYLRLMQIGSLQPQDRGQFMAYASQVMRSIIVDAIRARASQRRGGGLDRVTLVSGLADSGGAAEAEVLRVSEALDALREMDERLVTIVELRYYGGLSNDEVADVLDISERTV